MSVENVRRIVSASVSRCDSLSRPELMSVLLAMTASVARDFAETTFLEINSEASWSQASSHALANDCVQRQIETIREAERAGLPHDEARQLEEIAVAAFYNRIDELQAAHGLGGVA